MGTWHLLSFAFTLVCFSISKNKKEGTKISFSYLTILPSAELPGKVVLSSLILSLFLSPVALAYNIGGILVELLMTS